MTAHVHLTGHERKTRAVLHYDAAMFEHFAFLRLEGTKRILRSGGLLFTYSKQNLAILKRRLSGLGHDMPIVDDRVAPNRIRYAPQGEYVPKTKPYPLQERALKEIGDKLNFALFCEPGTGKTKMAIDYAGKLYKKGLIDRVLVVAPKGVHNQWIYSQLQEHSGVPSTGYAYRSGKKTLFWPFNGLIWFSINYEATITKKGREIVDEFQESGSHLVVFDESHYFKNQDTKRWVAAKGISDHHNVVGRLLMTGTPIAKNMLDKWAQFHVLDESIIGVHYKTAFIHRYCIMGGDGFQHIIGYNNLDSLLDKIRPYSFSATKTELGIPAKQHSKWVFDMAPKQIKMIRQIMQDLVAEIDSKQVLTIEHAVVQILKIQQISNGWLIDDQGEMIDLFPIRAHNPRLQALTYLFRPDSEQSIVWCRFKKDIADVKFELHNTFGAGCTSEYHGNIPFAERPAQLDKWFSHKARFLLATPGSGGVGLNLQEGGCRRAVYYSNSENAIQRIQSEDRIHRIGVDGPVTYFDLLARGSRDAHILANLREKKDFSSMVISELRKELLEILGGKERSSH